MLLRVYVDSRADFDHWVKAQQQAVQLNAGMSPEATQGRKVFERTACINCHAVAGTIADGRFGPDLTHLMSRDTLAAGAAPNTRENLRAWIQNPDTIKPGALMPAMNLSDKEFNQITAYLLTLH
jgi:cytochrome c oxidase subunit 2